MYIFWDEKGQHCCELSEDDLYETLMQARKDRVSNVVLGHRRYNMAHYALGDECHMLDKPNYPVPAIIYKRD